MSGCSMCPGLDIAEQVLDAGAQIATEVPANYAFIPLRAA